MPAPMPPKARYSKLSDSQRFNRTLLSFYNDSMNNAYLLSKRLNMPYSTIKRWIHKAREGIPVFKIQEHAQFMRQAVYNRYQEPVYGNLPTGKVVRVKKGDNYTLTDYDVTRGNPLPKLKGGTYQIIMEGRSRGEKRYVTTYTYGNLEDALAEAAKLTRKYKKFWKGRRQLVRYFKRK